MFFGDRLAKALNNQDLDVRIAAIREIGRERKDKYCRPLYDMLPSQPVDVQIEIAAALGMMTVPNSCGPLSGLLRSRNRVLRAVAVQSMRKIDDANPGLGLLAPAYFKFTEQDVTFLMIVLDVFGIKDKGTIATGLVSCGSVAVGDPLVLRKSDGRDVPTVCDGVDVFPLGSNADVHPGASIGVRVRALSMGEVGQGDSLVKL